MIEHQAARNRVLTTAGFWDNKYQSEQVAEDVWYRRFARRHSDRLLHRVLHSFDEPPSVLELGCAPGRMLCRLHRLRPDCRFAGIDYSATGVAAARQTLQAHGIDASIQQGDVRDLQFDEKFDLVVSFGLIEHFKETAEIIRHHAKFCRPQGSVLVTIPNFASFPVKQLAYWTNPEVAEKHDFEIMSEVALKRAMRQAHLHDIQAGAFGGPRIWMAGDRSRWTGRLYRRAAMSWNFVASVLPGQLSWPATYWAMGYASHPNIVVEAA